MSDKPYQSLEDFPKMPFLPDGLSSRFIRENRIVPLGLESGTLKIIMANPDDIQTVRALRVALETEIEAYGAPAQVIDEYWVRFYGRKPEDITDIVNGMDGDGGLEILKDGGEDSAHLKDLASEAPIIKLVNALIMRALETRASDIHLEPYEDELRVRYRIDGILHTVESVPKRLQPAIISRLKLMAKLNIAERRLPQDGRIRFKMSAKEIDMRVSTIPVLHGESLVMRLLDKESIVIDLDQLGFPDAALSTFKELIKKTHGLIFVTGPTGSGKTTTLYGALDKINSPELKIITVEDPIEYHLKGVNQIQVKPGIGLSFANTLRHIVRQDPDVIMIGEIRDLETAEIAIQAALTGHLVFSTLHTNDAASAITRLLDMGVESFLLSSTIRGILAQRLVRMICPKCKEAVETPGNGNGGPEAQITGAEDLPVFKGRGCEFCASTGYRGRTGIFELITVNEDIRKLIVKKTGANEIKEAARKNGMKTLFEDGIDKIRGGVTTTSELLRVTQEA
ncbi:MAG: type II secretion system ATPase GspE [Actinomycetota bacterium]|nr:type II secretion system ATPase GspE [Actinomycetota bacterium]